MYPTKSVVEMVEEIEDKITTELPRWDWQIESVAFTTII